MQKKIRGILAVFLIIISLFISQHNTRAAIGFGSAGAVDTGTTSLIIPHPTGITAGDMLVLIVGNKYPPNGPSTPAGWTLVTNGQASGGSGTSGNDSGNVYTTVFVKEAVGTESGNLTVTITSANTSMGRMFRYTKTAGAIWDYSATNGADTTPGTAWSVTGGVNPGITAGDIVVVGSAINGNTATA